MALDPATATWRGLVASLIAAAPVAALVGDRVVEDPEDNIQFPYVTLNKALVSPDDTDDTRGFVVNVGLEVHARDDGARDKAQAICGAIRDRLHLAPEALTVAAHTVFDVEVATYVVTPSADKKSQVGTMALVVTLEL